MSVANTEKGNDAVGKEEAATQAAAVSKSRVPFVIGVSGNMDPEGYDDDFNRCYASSEIQDFRSKIEDILDWITGLGNAGKGNCLDPGTGRLREDDRCEVDTEKAYHSCWKPLNAAAGDPDAITPVIILSSLAPGVDTLVVEIALEYAEKRRDAEISVRCPLPFPTEIYREASTFNSDKKKERFDKVLESLRKTKGFCEETDLFEVELDSDHRPEGSGAREDLEAIDEASGKPRRHLRYRAAGEYVATHSELLLAIHDVAFDAERANVVDIYESGTSSIVKSKRIGMTQGLLSLSNNIAWADNGPVLVMPVHRQKKLDLLKESGAYVGSPSPLHMLHPYDLMEGMTDLPDGDARWQKKGHELFRNKIERLKEFNALAFNPREPKALEELFGEEVLEHPELGIMLRQYNPLAEIRRRAASESGKLDGHRKKVLKSLVLWIFWAAFFFAAFDHESASQGGWIPFFVSDWYGGFQALFLLATLVLLWFSARRYFSYQRSGTEQKRYDYRAIGEALRVQMYWLAIGGGRGVSAEYMQRQRGELDWIRYVVSSLTIPLDASRKRFDQLKHSDRHFLLETVLNRWVAEQKGYFLDKLKDKEGFARRYENQGWMLALAGLISITCMLISEVFPRVPVLFGDHALCVGVWGLVAGLALVLVSKIPFLKRCKTPRFTKRLLSRYPFLQFLKWIFGGIAIWGGAIAAASVVVMISFLIGSFGQDWPDGNNIWIVLTSALLVGGGLSVAWGERNFYAEEGRIFRSMGSMHTCAERRLKPLLKRYGNAEPDGREAERLLKEIREIYHQIGCEALTENAEWLIQHRSRPLEPFMGA